MKKYVIAFLIWVVIIPIAILNGGFREYVLMEHLEMLALPISGIILSLASFLLHICLCLRSKIVRNEIIFYLA